MSLEFKDKFHGEDILIVELAGKLMEQSQIDGLNQWVTKQLENNHKNFIFDLHHMSYMNSSGLNVFIQLFTRIRNNGGELVFCNVPEKINNLLLITKLNNIFNIQSSEEEALNYLKR